MADATEKVEAGTEPAAKAAVPVVPLMMAVVMAVVVAVGAMGGVGYWLLNSGRLPIVHGATRVVVQQAEPVKTKLVPMEPLLVNLADDGGRAYLRVAMTLRVEDGPLAKGEKPTEEAAAKGKPGAENEAAVRDAALTVLGRQTGAGLLAPDGKEVLKAELKKQLAANVPEVKVVDLFFTEFLVQR